MEVKKPPLDSRRTYFKEEHIFINPVRQVSGFFERDYSCGMHQQGFYEINIVTRGSATHFIGDYQYTVEKGDCFIVPPDVWHGYVGGEGFDVYHLLLTASYIEKNASDLQILPAFSTLFKIYPLIREKYSSKHRFNLSEEEISDIMPVMLSLETHSPSPSLINNTHIANSEAMIIIAKLCDIYYNKYFLGNRGIGEDQEFMNSLTYIYQRYNEQILLDDIVKMAKMSRTAYLQKFKKMTGTSPQKMQTAYRISVSKNLLMQTSKSITDIAQSVGFYDLSHFIKVFTKEMGLSPTEYRKTKG